MIIAKKIIATTIILLFSGKTYCQSYSKLSGKIKGAEDSSKVFLFFTSGEKDSSYIVKEEFNFVKKINQKGIFFIHYKSKVFGRFDFPLFLEEKGSMQFYINDSLTQFKFSGDKNSILQNDFYVNRKKLFSIKNEIESRIKSSNNSTQKEILIKQLAVLDKKISDYPINWVKVNKSLPFSSAVIRLYIASNPNSGNEDFLAEKLYDALSLKAKEKNAEADILESWFEFYNDKYSRFQPGSPLPNFKLKDTSGNIIELTKFKGKYLLVDFWASWCGPCRANSPLLKEFYNGYKSKGLEVLSISLDTDSVKWKSAIKADEMDWHQASDLLGKEKGIGKRFRIFAIPEYILIDSKGKIIIKSIGGDVNIIKAELDKIFDL